MNYINIRYLYCSSSTNAPFRQLNGNFHPVTVIQVELFFLSVYLEQTAHRYLLSCLELSLVKQGKGSYHKIRQCLYLELGLPGLLFWQVVRVRYSLECCSPSFHVFQPTTLMKNYNSYNHLIVWEVPPYSVIDCFHCCPPSLALLKSWCCLQKYIIL